MTQPNPDETQLPLASWGHRLITLPIDAFICIVMIVALSILAAPVFDSNDRPPGTVAEALNDSMYLTAMSWLNSTIFLLVIWGGLFEGTWGMTLGKKLAGLKVVSAKDHNQTIGFMRGVFRETIRFSPIIFFCLSALSGLEENSSQLNTVFFLVLWLLSMLVFVLDHLWPLWDKEKQALHDKMANSHVVSRESEIIDRYPYKYRQRTGYLGSIPPSSGFPPLGGHRHDPR